MVAKPVSLKHQNLFGDPQPVFSAGVSALDLVSSRRDDHDDYHDALLRHMLHYVLFYPDVTR
jgi:hypothetical protein